MIAGLSPKVMIMIAIAAVIVIGLIIAMLSRHKSATQIRIDRIRTRAGVVIQNEQGVSLRRQEKKNARWVEAIFRFMPNVTALDYKLKRAGMSMDARQFVLMCIGLAMGTLLVVCVLFHKPLSVGILAALVMGYLIPMKLVKRRIQKTLKRFLVLFPDALDLIVRGLRSGLPISESIKLVANDIPAPVGPVFADIASRMKLGVVMEKALHETAHQLECTEFNFFTTSIVLQRETGGNLSEILNNLSDVLRKRVMMRMKIKSMSSEARASGYIVGSLPFFVVALVSFIAPDYIQLLWSDYRGNISVGIAAGLLFTGLWVMKRLANFEI